MSKKTDEAIAKITAECEGKGHLIPFEEHLTELCTNDCIAEKILQEDKTLQGSFEAMKKIALKRAQGNFAHIPDQDGFIIIEEYYGITDADESGSGRRTSNLIDITELL